MSPGPDLAIKIRLRKHNASDEPFIFKSWLNQHWADGASNRYLRKTEFFREHHLAVSKLLRRTPAIVAASERDPAAILGFLSAENLPGEYEDAKGEMFRDVVLHYFYVKAPYRGFGIGRVLLEAAGVRPNRIKHVTHWTRWCHRNRVVKNLVHNPYLLHRNPMEDIRDSSNNPAAA